jgi:23S rRNA pseudouridine955/2504/2580 synthase
MQTKSAATPTMTRTPVQRLSVDEEHAGQRIDNYLLRILPGVPRGRVYRMLRRGEVRVNGGRVKAEYKLCGGDEVRVPPVTLKPCGPEPAANRVRGIEDQIIFEDKSLIVVNKPSGLAVHGGSGISHGVIELLRAARPDLPDLSLAHRIDRETSGCLVLAKKRSALRRLHAMFREGRVEKNYLALVLGDWQFGDIVIDRPLLVTHRKGGERHVIVSPRGKPAQTRVRLSRRFGEFSLVQCQPATGRTHQIRVHLADYGHPIAGDLRYGDEAANARLAEHGLNRLFLHAQSIAFVDDNGNEQHFTAPLSPELDRFLNEELQ